MKLVQMQNRYPLCLNIKVGNYTMENSKRHRPQISYFCCIDIDSLATTVGRGHPYLIFLLYRHKIDCNHSWAYLRPPVPSMSLPDLDILGYILLTGPETANFFCDLPARYF